MLVVVGSLSKRLQAPLQLQNPRAIALHTLLETLDPLQESCQIQKIIVWLVWRTAGHRTQSKAATVLYHSRCHCLDLKSPEVAQQLQPTEVAVEEMPTVAVPLELKLRGPSP